MAKKSTKNIVYQETYKKNAVQLGKEHVIDIIKQSETTIFALKAGRYEDGKEFLVVAIDNIDFNEK